VIVSFTPNPAVGTHLGERADVERLVPLVRIETVPH